MKKFFGFNKLLASVAVLASVMIFQSCLDDDDNDYYRYALPNALVTVKPVADNSFFMQLDDSTTLLPVNMKNSPYGEKEVRALVNFDPVNESSGEYDKAVHINWIDSILTKPIAPDLGEENDKIYGMIRKTYLKEHRSAMYSLYMLEDRLTKHLNAVDDEAQERMGILVRQMMEKQGVTEELKARDQMVWVGAVNNIRNAAEEIVLKELIYR